MAPRTRHNKRTVKRTRKQQKRKEIKKNKTSVSNCITPQISLFIIGQVSKFGKSPGGRECHPSKQVGGGILQPPMIDRRTRQLGVVSATKLYRLGTIRHPSPKSPPLKLVAACGKLEPTSPK